MRDHQADRAGLSWYAGDEPTLLQIQHHLMNRRGRNLKIPLHVGLSRRPPVELGVVVYEGKVLPLPWRVVSRHSESPHERLVENPDKRGTKLGRDLGLQVLRFLKEGRFSFFPVPRHALSLLRAMTRHGFEDEA
jgi:hypothetical protein